MGNFLYISIATKIVVLKRDCFNHIISSREIIEKMSRYFQLDLYFQSEDDNHVYFDLKEDVIKNNLCSFLKEHVVNNGESRYIDEYLDNIELLQNKTTQEVIHFIKNEDIDYFNFYNSRYLKKTYLDNELKMYFEGINYIFDGKILIETYNSFFRYIHYRIRAPHKNPLEGTTFIDMS